MSSTPPLAGCRRVRVGSTNPPKLEGVRAALAAFVSQVEVEGVSVASGVPDQPLGFAEILAGARRRAEQAARSGACDLAVGYEDGLIALPEDAGWFNVGCAAVSDGRRVSLGLSSGFAYPPDALRPAVEERVPIGDAFDRLWAARAGAPAPRPDGASALSVGNVGKLTDGALPRAEYTRHAVLCALAAFLHPELYGAPGEPL